MFELGKVINAGKFDPVTLAKAVVDWNAKPKNERCGEDITNGYGAIPYRLMGVVSPGNVAFAGITLRHEADGIYATCEEVHGLYVGDTPKFAMGFRVVGLCSGGRPTQVESIVAVDAVPLE